jgi:tricorn protease-like protein
MHSLRDVDCRKLLIKKKRFWDLFSFVPFYLFVPFSVLPQPKSIAFAGNNQPVVLTTEAALVVNGNKVSTTKLGFEPSCIACFGDKIVIGAKEKAGAFQYSLAGGELTNKMEIAIKDPVFALRFSPDGRKLAVADKSNCISVVDSNDHHVIEKVYGHRARITTLAFSENGWLASGKNYC